MSIKRTGVLAAIVSATLAGSIGLGMATPQTMGSTAPEASGSSAAKKQNGAGRAGPGAGAYKLTPERLAKFLSVEKKLAAINESDPELIKAIAIHPSEELRKDWIRRTESRPKVIEVFKAAGITPRDYIQTAGAVARAITVNALNMKRQPVAKELGDSVPAEDIAFVENHKAELIAWQGSPAAQAVRPNTIEDIYTPPPAETASNTAPATQPAAAAAPAQPAPRSKRRH